MGQLGRRAIKGEKAMTPDQIKAREADIFGKPLRIEPIPDDQISAEVHELLGPPKGYGTPGELPVQFRIMLKHPELLETYRPMGSFFIVQGKLPPRDRELLILRNAWICQAPYEWGEHVAIGKRIGLTSEEIERVTQGPDAPGWSEHDRALLNAVAELHASAMIGDATWTILAHTLDDAQMLEVPLIVGQYQGTAYLQNALRLPLRPDNPGLAAR
jgi:4-carboxymuconolactone decarboxylase